ncbi:hypothetical protein HDU97_007937 [Phlyctochytrium planicorne]|nr:hypothetical protein HDU97_007937 [Phlyctochytrium planicorne]
MSLLTIQPIVFHALFWAVGNNNISLLAFYNLSLLVGGSTALFSALTRLAWDNLVHTLRYSAEAKPPRHPFETTLGLTAVMLFWVNYTAYCSAYHGYFCVGNFESLPPSPITNVDQKPSTARYNLWMVAMGWTVLSAIAGYLFNLFALWLLASLWVYNDMAELAVWCGQVDQWDALKGYGGSLWEEEKDLILWWEREGKKGLLEGKKVRLYQGIDWKNARGLRMLKALTSKSDPRSDKDE